MWIKLAIWLTKYAGDMKTNVAYGEIYKGNILTFKWKCYLSSWNNCTLAMGVRLSSGKFVSPVILIDHFVAEMWRRGS